MNKVSVLLLVLSVLGLQACDSKKEMRSSPLNHVDNSWYKESAAQIEARHEMIKKLNAKQGSAKNIILFVGDGMSIGTVTAARILAGQQQGRSGEENSLSFGLFPFTGLAKTYNVNAQTPDSAGTMTAIISGVKTDFGVIGVDENIVRGDCATQAGNELVTALELAEIAGLSTGIVTTARITHATPAATYAKSADRNWEDISDMPEEAVAKGCEDIASQLVNFDTNLEARYEGVDIDGIDVMMGGGRRHFLPADAPASSDDAESAGDRTDGRNLVVEWQDKYPSGSYIEGQQGFSQIQIDSTAPLLALFAQSHMRYEADRKNNTMGEVNGEPSLTEMTSTAIDLLDNNPKGFFLMVESGRIDHGHHAGSAFNALTDAVEFSRAIQAAVDRTDAAETLIIVTADHGHVFTMAGYPKRGNPILGKVVNVGTSEFAKDANGLPYTTLGYANGPGFHDFGDESNADVVYSAKPFGGRTDLSAIDTKSSGFHQETLIPKIDETHSGEDVAIYASGPGAYLVSGTQEQNAIFHIMNFAGGLVAKAQAAIE
jgi:alkaline phosphatase